MSPDEFAAVKNASNVEAATHLVFDRAYSKWINRGVYGLTTGELTVYCVETVFGEVCNGGIPQYFDNESGQLAQHAPTALRRVGLTAYADLLSEALSLVEKSSLDGQLDEDDPRHPWIEWNLKEDASEAFEDLDNRFFELFFADRDEFRNRLFRYIVEHEAEFVQKTDQ